MKVDFRVGQNQQQITADLQGPSAQLAPGTRLQSGRYIIESVVGKGGMGHVYRIRDTHFSGPVSVRALKEMIPRFSDLQANIINFEREANVLASLRHTGIPRVYDSFTESKRAYLVLDFIPGSDLEQVLQNTPQVLDEQTVGRWMIQLCEVVEYLHSCDVIFRDLKPSNVILTPNQQIVLIDFGIAKVFQDDEQQTNVGTNGYAAPEQYERQAEKRSDIYSLGAMLHHLLTKTDPRFQAPFSFKDRPIRALNSAVSVEMEALVMRCLEHDKTRRFQTVGELRQALEDVLGVPSARSAGANGANGGTGSRKTAAPAVVGGTGPRVAWRFQTEEEVRSTPATDGKLIYIGSYDNNLYALDRHTGKWRWQFASEGGICSTPAIWRDLVVVGSEDFNVYALERKTGKTVWQYRTWHHVRSSPRFFEDRLYVGSDDGHMHAIDPETGRMIWRYKTYREVRSSAAHANGVLFFGSNDEYVYAVDALTGERKWSYRTQGEVESSPCVVDNNVYIGSNDFTVYCLEVKSGWLAWGERTERPVTSTPCLAGDRLYIGSADGNMYCLNKRTGAQVWKFHTSGQIAGNAVVVGGRVLFGATDGILYCLEAASGKLMWQFSVGEKLVGTPLVIDQMVYVGGTDGVLYALDVDM